jgi:hypothetical protein
MAAEKRASRTSQRSKGKKAGARGERRSVIVTFTPKDKRPEGEKDKLEVLSEIITSEVSFLNAEQSSAERRSGSRPRRSGMTSTSTRRR